MSSYLVPCQALALFLFGTCQLTAHLIAAVHKKLSRFTMIPRILWIVAYSCLIALVLFPIAYERIEIRLQKRKARSHREYPAQSDAYRMTGPSDQRQNAEDTELGGVSATEARKTTADRRFMNHFRIFKAIVLLIMIPLFGTGVYYSLSLRRAKIEDLSGGEIFWQEIQVYFGFLWFMLAVIFFLVGFLCLVGLCLVYDASAGTNAQPAGSDTEQQADTTNAGT